MIDVAATPSKRAIARAARASTPMAIQTLMGYSSAGLGLLCELAIAARFGATAKTDLYRWAGLMPFYANAVFGAVLIPVFLRSRLFPRGSSGLHVLSPASAKRYCYSAALSCAAAILVALTVTNLIVSALHPGAITLFVQSGLLACAMLLYAIMTAPFFFHGWIWSNVLAGALLNLTLICALLSPLAGFYTVITCAMGAAVLVILCLPWIAIRIVGYGSLAVLEQACKAVAPTPIRDVAMTALASAASAISTTIYFSALTAAGAGTLSLYTTTQKAGLLLAVPANAILNKFIRDDFLADHGVDVVRRAIRAVLPILLVSPVFAVLSFSFLSAVYGISPIGGSAKLIAAGCAAVAALTALSSCMTLLTVGRTSGRHAGIPAVISIMSAIAGSGLIWAFHGPSWSTAVPTFGAAISSTLGMTWISRRVGRRARIIWAFALISAVVAGGLMIALTMPPLLYIPQWVFALRLYVLSSI